MSAIDLATLRDTLRFRGDYQNTRKFPNSAVNGVIQRAFGAFYELVASCHQGYWDTNGLVYTTAGVDFVALPKDCWRALAVDRLDSDVYCEIAQVGLDQRNKYGSATGKPLGYRLSSRGIEVQPLPDGVYTLKVTYTPMAPSLAESQPREYYNGWDDYVIEVGLLELDKREGKPLTDRIAAIEFAEKRIRAGVNERRSQEPEYIPLREFGDYDPFGDGIL